MGAVLAVVRFTDAITKSGCAAIRNIDDWYGIVQHVAMTASYVGWSKTSFSTCRSPSSSTFQLIMQTFELTLFSGRHH